MKFSRQILGALFLGVILVGCGTFSQNSQIETNVFQTDKPLLAQAGLFSSQPDEFEKLLTQIENKPNYRVVVLVRSGGADSAELYQEPFQAQNNISLLSPQLESVDVMEAGRVITQNMLAKEVNETDLNRFFTPDQKLLLKENFPTAHLIFLSVPAGLPNSQLEQIALSLKIHLPEESLVLGEFHLRSFAYADLAEYLREFTSIVLKSFDEKRFQNLPTDHLEPLLLATHFAKFRESTLGEVVDSADVQVIYKPGVAVSDSTVFLTSFGDIMLGRHVRTLMNANGLDYPFVTMDTNVLASNDLLLGNLEGPIARNAIKTSKTIAFRFMPDVVPLLKKYHFDLLSLANNHSFDMGRNGFYDSFDLLREGGILPFGNPEGITGESVAKIEIRGRKLAFLGMEEVIYKIDTEKAIQTVKDITSEGYGVIPVIHWGIEYKHQPNARQEDLAHQLIDAGAIALIGHHPHVVQSVETYKDRPIFYSLGNAVFDQYFSADTQVGLGIGLIISDEKVTSYFFPIQIRKSQMVLMNEDERKSFLEKLASYSLDS